VNTPPTDAFPNFSPSEVFIAWTDAKNSAHIQPHPTVYSYPHATVLRRVQEADAIQPPDEYPTVEYVLGGRATLERNS
jgi:hypothetical protein